MTIKTIRAEHISTGSVKLGRRRPLITGHRLKMKNYLNTVFEQTKMPPASCDYSAKAVTVLQQMYLNDQLGDCVIAALCHVLGVMTSNALGTGGFIATADQVRAMYEVFGYNPDNPATDQGVDEPTAFHYYTENKFPDGSKLLGFLGVDPNNQNEIKTGLSNFENLMFGVEMPDAWIANGTPPAGTTWDVAGDPNPENGHCFNAVGYDPIKGIQICSWGQLYWITWAAVAYYCQQSLGGALYCLLATDQIPENTALSPSGLNWPQLIADFDFLGGSVQTGPVTPASAYAPPRAPVAPGQVSLFQAQQWASANLEIQQTLTQLQKRQLIAQIQHNLDKHWPRGEVIRP